jgi:hypothetical protein
MTPFMCRTVPACFAWSRVTVAIGLVTLAMACHPESAVSTPDLPDHGDDGPAAASSQGKDEHDEPADDVPVAAARDASSASAASNEAGSQPASSESDAPSGSKDSCEALFSQIADLGAPQSCSADSDCHLIGAYYIRPSPTAPPSGVFVSDRDLSNAERLLGEARDQQCLGFDCALDGDTFRAKCEAGSCVAKRQCCNCATDAYGTLVSGTAVDTSAPIRTPHVIVGLNAANGALLDPPVRMTTDREGRFVQPYFAPFLELALHVEGQGPASSSNSTYDSLTIGFDVNRDPLLRVWSVSTAAIPGTTAGFSARQDRAQLAGRVYITRGAKRVGVVGCAKLFLDAETGVALDSDQRYISASGLPTTLAMLGATNRERGGFYFGNIAKGMHTLRVSVDEGRSFIAERRLFVPFSRSEASSPYKDMVVQLAIEIEGADPTPPGCAL